VSGGAATSSVRHELHPATATDAELLLASRPVDGGLLRTELSVPGVHCAGCIRRVEAALAGLDGVKYARVNLSTHRAAVHWQADVPPPMLATLSRIGYEAHLFEAPPTEHDKELGRLIRALAVAGFCAMNIMLFSVSVWAGADDGLRDLFHWISAALALPALVYSGRIFFLSAWNAVRHGRTNMDVPISIGVILAFALSLYDTVNHGAHAYFDASVTLLFFLLAGRTLDHVMRERARVAVAGLARLAARGATLVMPDGGTVHVPISDVEPGMSLLLAPGERVPVDAEVLLGTSDVDTSITTGEATPVAVAPGSVISAGALNLTGALHLQATASADDSFLAEIIRLMEVAEGGRARYRRIADRVSQLYAPVVHLAAAVTFAGWMIAGADWHRAIGIAIAVLIITCPCALGLAVPIVQVVAGRRLFENGIMAKDGSAMERLAEVDTVVFDKTGTLTMGRPSLANHNEIALPHLALAAAIGRHSRHPLSQSLANLVDISSVDHRFQSVEEVPGSGLEAKAGTTTYRLGRPDWALADGTSGALQKGTVLSADGRLLARFVFEDRLREGAAQTVAELRRRGLEVALLSGDQPEAVEAVAGQLGISDWAAHIRPDEKLARIEALSTGGRKVLMVGDGLNDAPALSGAYVSMAPAEAADVGRNAADFVFMHADLRAVVTAMDVADRSGRLIRQNIGLAIAYNSIAVPFAVLGLVTPLIAALAMSSSSIVVVANSLRLTATRAPRTMSRPAVGRAEPEPAG
jgi:Cu2+-exporting ATPase